MDLDWSPWEEEATKSTDSTKAPIQPPSLDDHDLSWNAVARGAEWASDVQNDWASNDGKSQRERRLSETSGWGISDGLGRSGGSPQNLSHKLYGPRLEPPTLQSSPRPHSPDPWAAVSAESEPVHIKEDIFESRSSAKPQESEVEDHTENLSEEAGREWDAVRDNGGGVLQELPSGDRPNESGRTENPPQDLNVEEVESFQQLHTDATSSRPSSSPSRHGTESSRTSFEQEPNGQPSLGENLVSHFDHLAIGVEKEPGGLSENKSVRANIQAGDSPGEESDSDDFGEFEEEAQDSKFEIPDNLSGGSDQPNNNDGAVHKLSFDIDQKLLETLLSEICPISESSENQNAAYNDDVFTTIEERKTWHRISRFGTMRKHDSGNDENYRRVKWQQSKIRDETIQIISRWRNEDSISDGLVLGGGDRGSMFGWEDKEKRKSGPINMSAIWAERAQKHRSMPLPISSTTSTMKSPSIKSPTVKKRRESIANPKSPAESAPTFGWSTKDEPSMTNKPDELPSPVAFSPMYTELPAPPPIVSPTAQSSRFHSPPRRTSMDFSLHPRIASIRGLGHRPTKSLDLDLAPSIPTPLIKAPKPMILVPAPPSTVNLSSNNGEDDDDWGDMVSSTPDLDAVFQAPSEAVWEPHGSRNRADSAPDPKVLERVSQTNKRPISLQPGMIPSLSIANLADLGGLGEAGHPKEDQRSAAVAVTKTEMMVPTINPTSIIPNLSVDTDDFDPWASTSISAITGTQEPPVKGLSIFPAQPESAPKSLEIIGNDFDTWASFENVSTPAQRIDMPTVSKTVNDTTYFPQGASLPPVSTATTTNVMDGWADADFSIFETALSTAVPLASVSREEPQKRAANPCVGNQKEGGNATPSSKESAKKNSEEERIVRSIVRKLPDLSYMLRR